jgi:Nucleotidyl transferase of unknown function (DUF2204)
LSPLARRVILGVAASQSDEILDVLKRVARILREADIEFALGGGLSAWVHGGPPTENDVDILIRESDVDHALGALEAAGLETARPPEGWLVKAWCDGVLVDLMYEPSGVVVDDSFIERCEVHNVAAVRMRVMPVDDLLVGKLLALTEHHLDFAPILEHARALREQIDWVEVARRTQHSAFARAFLFMIAELGIRAIPEPMPVHLQEEEEEWSRAG